MLRKLAIALLALLATASAVAPASAEVNLHNGFIQIVDDITYSVDLAGLKDPSLYQGPPPRIDFLVRVRHEGLKVTYTTTLHGKSAFVNECCILAGSYYSIEGFNYGRDGNVAGAYFSGDVTPRLCNVRGIPFGYAKLVVTGHVTYTPHAKFADTKYATIENAWKVHGLRLTRVDTDCSGI